MVIWDERWWLCDEVSGSGCRCLSWQWNVNGRSLVASAHGWMSQETLRHTGMLFDALSVLLWSCHSDLCRAVCWRLQCAVCLESMVATYECVEKLAAHNPAPCYLQDWLLLASTYPERLVLVPSACDCCSTHKVKMVQAEGISPCCCCNNEKYSDHLLDREVEVLQLHWMPHCHFHLKGERDEQTWRWVMQGHRPIQWFTKHMCRRWFVLCVQTYMLKLARSGEEAEKAFIVLESGVRFHTTKVLSKLSHSWHGIN